MKTIIKETVVAASRRVSRPVPAEWGASELTRFISIAEEQAYASFATLRPWVQTLELIDRNLTENAPTFFHEIDQSRRTSAKLFMRALGTYRAACRLVLSGQVFEATVLVRSILESATYAWVCGSSLPHREAWEARGSGISERTAAKNLFKWGEVRSTLEKVDANLANRIQTLYEQVIEYGAHPNVDGVALSCEIKPLGEDKYEISTIFLDGRDAVLLGVLDLSRAMEFVYRLLKLTIGDRLRLLDIDRRMNDGRRLIVQLIDKLERERAQVLVAQSS